MRFLHGDGDVSFQMLLEDLNLVRRETISRRISEIEKLEVSQNV